ncbi:MAG: O-antigen ligase family protein [Roseiflexaceae bacterium]|nr:O-antigen ligase family protein [Roseiflexaceae bacterium]
MADVYHIHVRPAPRWVAALLGLGAGLLAAALLMALSPVYALAGIAVLVAGVVALAFPHLALYAAVASMIVFWPGTLIKSVDLALGALALMWAVVHRRSLLPPGPVLPVLAALVGLVWVSSLRVGGEEAFKRALGYTSYIAIYWTVSTFSNSGLVVRRLIGALLIGGVVIAVIGLIQLRFPFIGIVSFVQRFSEYSESGSLVDAQLWDGVFRIESLTGGPNLLGLSMQILLPFAFFWTIGQTQPRLRLAGLAGLALMAAAMVLSLTRGVLVTTPLIIVPIVMARVGWRRSLPYAAAGLLVAATAVLVWEPLRNRVASNVTELLGGDSTQSGTWRLESFPVGLRMFGDYFWQGAGIEQQVTLWKQYAPSDLIVLREMVLHNDYLLIGIELGVVGVVLMLALLLLVWRQARFAQRHFRATKQRTLLGYAYAAEAAWLAIVADLMLYPLMHNFRYFWVLIAIIGALGRVAADQKRVNER